MTSTTGATDADAGDRARRRCPAGVLAAIRPRPRWTEARLLALVALALVVGSVSLRADA